MSQAVRALARDLAAHVEWLALSGVEAIPEGVALPRGGGAASPGRDHGEASRVDSGEAKHDLSGGDLGELQRALAGCERCRLARGRTHIVFGTGDPQARVVFVGEGPGQEEDRQGLPFVGAAGALLTDIIEKGMRVPRSSVYICNVVKCRPPGNRNPEPDEVEACSPFLARQIDLVRPDVIVALGKFAAQTLLETATPITQLRGRWHEYRGIPLMPTFHPAHLLRNPAFKREVWEDIKQVMARLGLRSG
ncbi:MAG: uracil-DNA glycosylase [Deltaproteobacteria bacterium]|nr:uracil-DNA glycosylase [Deltaproteobacteria bacterium]